jgi:antitoxin ParD1/3/4
MNISLPDALGSIAEQLAAQAGFNNADEYVAELIRRDHELQQSPDSYLRQTLAGADLASVNEEVLARRKQKIEALLIQGLESGPATLMTADGWAALRQRVQEKLGKRNGQ